MIKVEVEKMQPCPYFTDDDVKSIKESLISNGKQDVAIENLSKKIDILGKKIDDMNKEIHNGLIKRKVSEAINQILGKWILSVVGSLIFAFILGFFSSHIRF
jgi:hypothetical protein